MLRVNLSYHNYPNSIYCILEQDDRALNKIQDWVDSTKLSLRMELWLSPTSKIWSNVCLYDRLIFPPDKPTQNQYSVKRAADVINYHQPDVLNILWKVKVRKKPTISKKKSDRATRRVGASVETKLWTNGGTTWLDHNHSVWEAFKVVKLWKTPKIDPGSLHELMNLIIYVIY